MNKQTDQELLRAYTAHRSEPAFAELVRRHIDLVYSAAVRMVCDAHLAQDVTQATFIALAQNTNHLTERAALSGWLHRTAQNLASKTVRTDVRRRAREQEAVVMNELLSSAPDVPWEHIAPHLDAALSELNDPERDAVLLRYFEKKSAAEIGSTLGISSEAAQKRVSRAVERLREFFAKRGVSVGAGGLVVAISANAVQAAPVGLAVTISAAALAGTTVTTSTLVAATTKTIAMTTLQKTLVTITIAALAGAGIYQAKQAHDASAEAQMLRQRANYITQLVQERDEATNRIAELAEELTRARMDNSELLKLRGEVGLLRRQQQDSNKPQTKPTQPRFDRDQPDENVQQEVQKVMGKMTDGKNFAMQAIIFASDNQGWLPTNGVQIARYAKDYSASGSNEFEFVHSQSILLKELGTNVGLTIVVRETKAWQSGDGKWRRVYGFADGHSLVAESVDGNFADWEAQNTYNPETVAK